MLLHALTSRFVIATVLTEWVFCRSVTNAFGVQYWEN